jgi:O-antigen/teichoic acid export membrane protein
MLKKLLALLSDAAIYGVSNALSQLINLCLLPLLTVYLTKSDYGVMGRLTMFAMVFGPLANLGMTNAIYRRYNTDKQEAQRRETLSTGLASVVCSSLFLLAACQLAAEPLSGLILGNVGQTHILRLAFVSAALVQIGTVPLVVLRASRRVKTIAALNVAKLLCSVSMSLWFVVVQEMGVLGYVMGLLIADIIFFIVQFSVIAKAFRFLASWSVWKRMAAYGLPFVPHHLQAAVLYQFAEFMTGNMLGLENAGLYNMAAKFALPVGFVVNAVNSAWGPYKFQIHADDENPAAFFRTAVTFYCAGIFYLWVGIAVWGPELLRLMTTAPFHPAATLVPVLALIPVSQGLFFMLGTGIELSDNTRPMPLISLVGLAAVVTGAFTLIPRIGMTGAALSTMSGWLMMAAMAFSLARRRFAIHYDWSTIASLLLLAAGCFGLDYLCRDLPVGLRILAAVGLSVVYPMVAILILLRSETERDRIQMLWSRVRRRPAPSAVTP